MAKKKRTCHFLEITACDASSGESKPDFDFGTLLDEFMAIPVSPPEDEPSQPGDVFRLVGSDSSVKKCAWVESYGIKDSSSSSGLEFKLIRWANIRPGGMTAVLINDEVELKKAAADGFVSMSHLMISPCGKVIASKGTDAPGVVGFFRYLNKVLDLDGKGVSIKLSWLTIAKPMVGNEIVKAVSMSYQMTAQQHLDSIYTNNLKIFNDAFIDGLGIDASQDLEIKIVVTAKDKGCKKSIIKRAKDFIGTVFAAKESEDEDDRLYEELNDLKIKALEDDDTCSNFFDLIQARVSKSFSVDDDDVEGLDVKDYHYHFYKEMLAVYSLMRDDWRSGNFGKLVGA